MGRRRWCGWTQVEAGGTLLLEAVGVVLSPGSTGTWRRCSAGWCRRRIVWRGLQVTSATGTGVVSVAPLVQGAVAGLRTR
jgi:hypothetical protein